MILTPTHRALITLLAIGFAMASTRSAQADPIVDTQPAIAGYNLIDLGPGNPTFSTLNGTQVVIGSNGLAYAYQPSPALTPANTQQLTASGFPITQWGYAPPAQWGDNSSGYINPLTNGEGYVVFQRQFLETSYHLGGGDLYEVKQNLDGSWASPIQLWSTTGSNVMSAPPDSQAVAVNRLGEVLGLGQSIDPKQLQDALLYLPKLNKYVDLYSVSSAADTWRVLAPVGLDEQGRVLLGGYSSTALLRGSSTAGIQDSLLLVPPDVSSDPIAIPAPEPGSLALAALIIVGLVARRPVAKRRAARKP